MGAEYESTLYETVESDDTYRLWQLWRDTESDFHESVQWNIIHNPDCPAEILDEIARKGDPVLIDLVALHDNLAPKTGVNLAETYPNVHDTLTHRDELSPQIGEIIALESDSQSTLMRLYKDSYSADFYRSQIAGREKLLPDYVQEIIIDVDYYNEKYADQAKQLLRSQNVNPAIVCKVLNHTDAWECAGIHHDLANNTIFEDQQLYEIFQRNHIEIMDFKNHSERGKPFARYEHRERIAREKERARIAFQTQQSKTNMTGKEPGREVSGMEMNW